MSGPERIFPSVVPDRLEVHHPTCSRCAEPVEKLVRAGARVTFAGLCKAHGEREWVERWKRRWALADTPEKQARLVSERKAWEAAGHVFPAQAARWAP